MPKKKFIVLEGLIQRNRFFTTNNPDRDQTKLIDGSVAYAVLGYANTPEEALDIILNGTASLYTVVHLSETDGDMVHCTGTVDEMKIYISDMELCIDDCIFIKGVVVSYPM